MLQQILADPGWLERMTPADLRALSALIYHHINAYGTFELDLSKRLSPPRPELGAPSPGIFISASLYGGWLQQLSLRARRVFRFLLLVALNRLSPTGYPQVRQGKLDNSERRQRDLVVFGIAANLTPSAVVEVICPQSPCEAIYKPGVGNAVFGIDRHLDFAVLARARFREDLADPIRHPLEAMVFGNTRHALSAPAGQIWDRDLEIRASGKARPAGAGATTGRLAHADSWHTASMLCPSGSRTKAP
jgi:hypothetical protein